ncbi:hypothetical protein BJ508DRAFT_417308 [Ascobolus immersus RN42]|uniref:DUF7102 domain-containing protein n=1 Tax=Ascobolus immersus RN42 TaxID=1160509 RepID=A0A3N4HV11_ASCIM|nr:hypothetical protein BJ508DRAFT_417308 [Ascobolus immersus RN42]
MPAPRKKPWTDSTPSERNFSSDKSILPARRNAIESSRKTPSSTKDNSETSNHISSSQMEEDIQKALEILSEGETEPPETVRSDQPQRHQQSETNGPLERAFQSDVGLPISPTDQQASSSSLGKRKLLPQDSLSRLISSRAKRSRPSTAALTFDTRDSLSSFLGLRGNAHLLSPKPEITPKAPPRPPTPEIQLISSSPEPEGPLPIPQLSQTYTIVIPTTHLVPDHPLQLTQALRQLTPLPNVVPRDFPHPKITADLIISPTTAVVITSTLLLTQVYVLPGQEGRLIDDQGFKVETNLVKAKMMHLLTFGFQTVLLLIVSSIMGEDDPVIKNVRSWAIDRNVASRVIVRVISRMEDSTVGLAEALARFGAPGEWAPAEETEAERHYVAQGWNPFYA